MADTLDLAGTTAQTVRERILAAARLLFLQNGFTKTSVSAIVAEAHTSKREFYKYYSRREDVFLEVVNALLASAAVTRDMPDRPLDELLPDLAVAIYKSHLNASSLGLFRASIVASAQSPDLDRIVYQSRARASQALGQRLDDWRARGAVQFDDPQLAALRFGFLAINGLKFTMGGPIMDDADLPGHARKVTHLFLHGCATPGFRMRPDRPVALGAAPGRVVAPFVADNGRQTRLDSDQWQAVYDEAWAEFARHGYPLSSVERVARACKIARTTIYRSHPSKRDLYEVSIARVIDRIYRSDLDLAKDISQPRDVLIEIAFNILESFLSPDNVALHKMLVADAGEIPEVTYKLYEYIVNIYLGRFDYIFEVLMCDSIIEGEDAAHMAWYFFILVTFGARLLFVQPASIRERYALISEAVNTFLYGISR
ncbi:TetR/AcrR family transcriptional regulator [Sphingomonas sp. KC8]|uniref:TetR/AcrR family transcriptional regulator n=1 Tax=Sphingomonas sp. KC8 TaxID=1030157 RepID=UPI0002488A5E|nr:TetR/AcrR family transcriptional regulator [Sphingomonas sp. KC8]ARS25823.1 putative TetR family transcriptional regulator [Sphingomonas sp. KC8]